MYSRSFLLMKNALNLQRKTSFNVKNSQLVRLFQTTSRLSSTSKIHESRKIPCDIVKCFKDGSFFYDKEAKSLFQFESSPAVDIYEIPTEKREALDQAWLNNADVTNQQLIERLHFILDYCRENDISITSSTFDKFVDNFVSKLSGFTENEVIISLQIFSRMSLENETMNSRNFVELWMALDDNCSKYTTEWDIDKLLAVCGIWTHIPHTKKTNFAKMVCQQFIKKGKYYEGKQLYQAVHFSNAMRKFDENNIRFEKDFDRVIDKLSLSEVATLCYTFNRTDMRIQMHSLVEKIIQKAITEDVNALGDKPIAQLLKTIYLSSRFEFVNQILELMRKLRPELEHRPLRTCVQICRIGQRHLIHDHESIGILVRRAIENIKQFSVLDMEATCLALSYAAYKSETGLERELLGMILKELPTRSLQILFAPKKYVTLVYYLAVNGFADHELIHNALRDDLLKELYAHHACFPPEVYKLDAYTRVNLKDSYKGNQLPQKSQKLITKLVTAYIPLKNGKFKIYGADTMLLQIADIVDDLHKHYQFGHALPHYEHADIYVIFDKDTKKVIDFTQEFPEPYSGKIISKDDLTKGKANLEVIAIVSSYWKDFCRVKLVHNSFFQLKLDQLKILGYHSVHVNHYQWLNLKEDQRSSFIENEFNAMFEKILSEK